MTTKEPCPPNNAEDRQSPFRWTFVRRGGFDQVEITSGAALLALDQLDQKLWTALSCPTHGLEFDEDTLRLIDSDADGRIRVPELIAAIKWAGKLLKNPDDLLKGSSHLSLDATDESCEEGAQILKSARRILINLGKPDATVITVEDTANRSQIFANTPFNGDGIICPESAEDAETAQAIRDVMECMGSEMDRSGRPGIGEQHVSAFFAEAEAYLNWWTGAQESLAPMFPLGSAMEDVAAIFEAVRPKIEDYFVRCHLACYDDRALEPLNPSAACYQSLTAKTLSVALEDVAALPLARIAPGASLPLTDGVNPAWVRSLEQFRSTIVGPLLGDQTHLSYEDWKNLCARFDALDAWLAAKKGAVVERLGVNRLREILTGSTRQRILDLLERDRALQAEAEAIDQVDRLVRYHRDLFQLVRNFVSFSDFYSPKAQAVFQVGTLYLDQRSCSLCLRMDNIDAYSAWQASAEPFWPTVPANAEAAAMS